MPVKRDADLKRPDLRGKFPCGYCDTVAKHLASLNRHLRNKHAQEQKCLICDKFMNQGETVRQHMDVEHGLKSVYTCGCCPWTFRTKSELCVHTKNIKMSGQPGEAQPIAIGRLPPGSMIAGRSLSSEESVVVEPEVPEGWLAQFIAQQLQFAVNPENAVPEAEVDSKAASSSGGSESGLGSTPDMALSPLLSTEVEKEPVIENRPLDIINLLADARNIPMKKSLPSSSSNRKRKAAESVENPCMDDVIDLLANAPKKAKISPERQAELHNKRKSIHDIISNLKSKNEKKPDSLS